LVNVFKDCVLKVRGERHHIDAQGRSEILTEVL
jgi:hypothetical protein